MRKTKVALINMPFGFHIYPSIQLGTLSTLLKTHGWPVDSYYLNLQFAHQLDLSIYNQLCEERHLIGEWLFSELLFRDSLNNQNYPHQFASEIKKLAQAIDRSVSFLIDVKTKMAPDFLHWAAENYEWDKYDLIGFSSTFNQNVASLTLGKLIKERYPSIKLIYGGSNFESEMGLEYCRAFPWIDYAVLGEAENVLPAFMKSLETKHTPPKGVAYRINGEVIYEENHQMFRDFHTYGIPDYHDYFEQLRKIDPNSPMLENPIVLYETARGCWWGEKHHCTFCGLNAFSMEFRAKGIDQVKQEIAQLSREFDTFRFRIVDNILEMKYIDGVFGEFSRENYDMQFFIEVKSNLTRSQIKTLAKGGVNVIQPGIESFSPTQLQEMDKGVRPIQNILCLKWSMYYGIECEWNILTCFPGETDADYTQQIDLLSSLFHLRPPIGIGNLYLERFSPYFKRPKEYGISITGPSEAYRYVYDGDKVNLMKIAYDFEYQSPAKINPELKAELRSLVDQWQARHQSEHLPFLFFTKSVDFVTVYDGRPEDVPIKTRFEGAAARIIVFCNEAARSIDQIQNHLRENNLSRKETNHVEDVISELVSKHILYGEREKYLTLALPHNSNI